jgi:hypothetical protein
MRSLSLPAPARRRLAGDALTVLEAAADVLEGPWGRRAASSAEDYRRAGMRIEALAHWYGLPVCELVVRWFRVRLAGQLLTLAAALGILAAAAALAGESEMLAVSLVLLLPAGTLGCRPLAHRLGRRLQWPA